MLETLPATSAIFVSTHSWHAAYEPWKIEIFQRDRCIRPNKQQNEILQSIHQRCFAEVVDEDKNNSEPFLRLIHGVPVSGKSELFRWIVAAKMSEVRSKSVKQNFLRVANMRRAIFLSSREIAKDDIS